MLTTDGGGPLAPLYAATLAKHLGWEQNGDAAYWIPKDRPKPKYYVAEIQATQSEMRYSTDVSFLQLYLSSEPIHCRMLGEPFGDDLFFSLGEVWSGMPYSDAVIAELWAIDAWLEDNPMYRGLPKIAAKHETPDMSFSKAGDDKWTNAGPIFAGMKEDTDAL